MLHPIQYFWYAPPITPASLLAWHLTLGSIWSALTELAFMHFIHECGIYYLSSDINECDVNNGGCEHSCTNVIYSFECSCYLGYNLTENGFTCDGKAIL